MSAELIPLKQGQHVVTYVPKRTTDLPFFNLTYNRHNTPTKIKFEGTDEEGKPINWEVRHNTDDDIGSAGVQAHEVWYLLIKPAIDASRLSDGRIQPIIGLGGVRECLRMVGWTEGGHEARELIKVLRQITFAGCIADLWFPTGETDEEGKPTYKQIKGSFSRMTVYAIGEHHLTQEELKTANFDFDLEDKIYIELNRLEIALQEMQTSQQKIIDNEYMFSVKPVARRWYELMAGKVFGTVHYKTRYFKIRYSEYTKHHHTLKKFYTMKAVRRQMHDVVKDHLATGFLEKVEYKKIKESGKELDFEITYYVGEEATNSIRRIRGYLATKTRKKQIEVKKASKSPEIEPNGKTGILLPDKLKISTASNFESDSTIEITTETFETLALSTISQEHLKLLQLLTVKYSVSYHKAHELVTKYFDRIEQQIKALPYRNAADETSLLIRSIEQNYSLPAELLEAEKAENQRKEREAQTEKIRLERLERQKIINNCSICNENGFFLVPVIFQLNDKISIIRAKHECSHDAEKEQAIEQYDAEKHKTATPELIEQIKRRNDR